MKPGKLIALLLIQLCVTLMNCYTATAQTVSYAKALPDYSAYYKTINQANILAAENKHREALGLYLSAFERFRAFESDYIRAINISLKLENYKLTYELLKEKIIRTGAFDEGIFDTLSFIKFLESSYGYRYTDNRRIWEEANYKQYDIQALHLISEINARDQLPRNGTLYVIKDYFRDDSSYSIASHTLSAEVDHINYLKFKHYVDQYGFPGASRFGGKTIYTETFLTHVFRYRDMIDKSCDPLQVEKCIYLDSLLKRQIKGGELEPSKYAYAIDCSLEKDSMSYYAFPRFTAVNGEKVYINLPVKEPEYLNKRRQEIGLISIEEQARIYSLPLPPNYVAQKD